MPKPVLFTSLVFALPVFCGHSAPAAETQPPDDAPMQATHDAARDLLAARAANARAQHEGRSSVWMLKTAPMAAPMPSTPVASPPPQP